MEEVTAVASLTRVQVVVDHTMPTPLQRSTKLKISHWYFDQCLCTPSRLHLLSKTSGASIFLCNFFTHIHLTGCQWQISLLWWDFYWRPVYNTASKEYLRRIQIICMLLESTFHQLFCLKFSFKLVTLSKSNARKQKWVFFFWTQVF